MENKKVLLVIDGNSLLHRAFHALPPLTTKSGQETGAVYGFLLILFKAIKDTGANCVVACFDTKAKTFRHEKYDQYKIHRPQTAPGIISQIPVIKEVLSAFKVPVFALDGFEADDLIATIAVKNLAEETFILSGDLDNLQLVSEHVKVYTMGKGIKDPVIYDINKVEERFGVKPSQMNEYKALVGDVSDNVPGVKGIGKKTASEIIQKYGTIKNLYGELATDTAVLKPKVKEALKQNKESAMLSRELVETKKDIDINIKIEDCIFGKYDKKEIENIFQKLEFSSLLNRL